MAQLKSLDNEIDELRPKEAAPSITKSKQCDIDKRFVELSLKYVEYFNSLQLFLDAALLEVDQFAFFHTSCLRLGDVFPLVWDDSKLWPIVDYSGVRGFHSVRDDLHRARQEWNYDPSRPIEEDERNSGRRVLAQSVFDRAVEQFEKVYSDYDKIQLLSQVTKALDFYNTMDWAASLIHAWFVIEVFVNSVWIDYLSDRVEKSTSENSRIDSERRNALLGRDYTASIMTNVLELAGEIDHDVFRKIESVRQKRNDVAHSLEIVARLGDKLRSEPGKKKERAVGADHCHEAFTVISHFAKKRFGLDLGLERVR